MTIEKLSKINMLIQKIVFGARCNPKAKGTLSTDEIIEICREIIKEVDD